MLTRKILEKLKFGIREALDKFDSIKARFKRPIDFEWERYFDGFDDLILKDNQDFVDVELIKNETYTKHIS